jgi:hypothetical protein
VNAAAPSASQPFTRTIPSATDPWAPLDPHQANAADNKPLKRGKTWREPKLPTFLLPVSAIKQVRIGLPKVTNFSTPCFGCSQKVFASLRVKAASRLQGDTQVEQQPESALVAEDVAASAQDWNAQEDAPFYEEFDSDHEAALSPLPQHNVEDAQAPSHKQDQPDIVIDDMHSFQARCRSYMYHPHVLRRFDEPLFKCVLASALPEPLSGTASRPAGRDSPIRFTPVFSSILFLLANLEFQSNLAVRVREWQDKLDPLLKDQQSRSAFDIHSYEKQVIGIVSESGKLVQDEDGTQARLCSFSEAVAFKPQVPTTSSLIIF